MAVKRYSFPSEAKAEELILKLAHEDSELAFNKITVTETTHAIVCLGFQNVYEYNQETEENVAIKYGTTYDVDVFWKEGDIEGFAEFEVSPKTPNHRFA
jgi:predicted nucleic acid-binding protein